MGLRTLEPADLEQAWELDRDAFHESDANRERFMRHADPARLIGAFEGDRIVAMAGSQALGQFFGGRPVGMGGLYSVAVVPDRRGIGSGREVVTAAIRDMAQRGDAISTLFPGTTDIYRQLGWELAGAFVWRKIRPRDLRSLPRPEEVSLRPAEIADESALRQCYAAFAPNAPGFLDRGDAWWRRLFDRWQDRSVYLAEGAGGLEGYLVYEQTDGEFSGLGGPFGLVVDECVATTRAAMLALWRLMGSWSSQTDRVLFRSGPEEALLLLLPEQDAETIAEIRWMTRVLDAPAAVEARGFADCVEAEVPLVLSDPVLSANEGPFVLSVKGGRGRLERGGNGSMTLTIGGFSSLYTGFAASALLERAGLLAGGTAAERAALDAAFAGPNPWMPEEF